jgi:hypothetical protein
MLYPVNRETSVIQDERQGRKKGDSSASSRPDERLATVEQCTRLFVKVVGKIA